MTGNTTEGTPEGAPPTGPRRDEVVESVLTETSRQLRAPWAAGIAGILFSILFTAALLLLRSQSRLGESDEQVRAWFASGEDLAMVIGGLYLVPFAGIAFLWFIAVVRDQIGEREDRFFATVFFGSGVLFVALMFASSAAASSIVVGERFLGLDPPSAEIVRAMRSLSYTLLFAFATRAAALFLLSTATIGLRSQTFPRWFGIIGYVIGLILMVFVTLWDWSILVLPAWVLFVSLFIMRRERARRQTA